MPKPAESLLGEYRGALERAVPIVVALGNTFEKKGIFPGIQADLFDLARNLRAALDTSHKEDTGA